ncbi:hypothetical protein P7C73_g1671, partial [Tremellales sp. Uapishka_1]
MSSAAMDIDKPLDEIIAAKPRTKRGPRKPRAPGTGASAAPRGGAPAAGGARDRYASTVPKTAAKPLAAEATKIIVSNLPTDVTEAAVRDLMQSTVGPVKHAQITYNAGGKSTGVATVLFKNRGDGNKAHAAYHNRMIDNR